MSNRQTHLAHSHGHKEEPQGPDHSGGVIAILQVQPYGPGGEGGVIVTSPAVDADGRLDPTYAQVGDDVSPPLEWAPVEGARAWAVIVQDPDAPHPEPVLHWAIWNLPAESVGLPQAVGAGENLFTPQDAVQGANTRGEHRYMGPKPPPGHGVHRYHFQVFALGAPLTLDPSASLVELVGALKGDTLASGELVATFETPEAPGEA